MIWNIQDLEGALTPSVDIEEQIALVAEHDNHRNEEKWIVPNRFSERLGNAESQAADDVLLAGDQVEGSVLAAGRVIVLNSR